ncbi:MAG TPA: hypothetical protein VK471_06735 [Solirubrobacterales bacterium]|nr:hypothetical protein [Solirubrobacterales bacterium]
MADVTHTKIDEMDAIDGFFKGIKFHKAAAGLGVSAFGISIIDGEQYPIDADHIARVSPEVKRKIAPGPDGIRLLVIGATPGEPYATGGTL